MRLIDTTKTFYRDHKKVVSISLLSFGALIFAILIALFIFNSLPKPAQKISYKYNPVNACDLLTMNDAHSLLGKDVIGSPVAVPNVSGGTATSTCSYTDQNTDQSAMKVAALAVLSAVDDKGVATVKSEFDAKKSEAGMESVENMGDEAYYDPTLGQLNILKSTVMLRISYGVGAAPQNNSLDDTKSAAGLILGHLSKK